MLTLNISKTFKAISIATLFICGLTAQSAIAETKDYIKVAAATPSDPDFAKLDANKNGKISLKEAVKDKSLSTTFDAVDANKDGNISADEYAAYKVAMTGSTTAAPADASAAPDAMSEPAPAK